MYYYTSTPVGFLPPSRPRPSMHTHTVEHLSHPVRRVGRLVAMSTLPAITETKMPTRIITTPQGDSLKVLARIGAGQYGVASVCKNAQGKSFCIKEIAVHAADEDTKSQAINEVRLLQSCKHEHIIAYHDSWFDARRLNILMEYAPNSSLDNLVHKYAKEGLRFTEMYIGHSLQQLSSALVYIHDTLKIMHRDLKPGNILIAQYGALKLGDFGLSKPLDARNMCQTVCGTPLYMSPEQMQGKPYTTSSDVWSLGCIIYELMALRSPWHAVNYPQLVPQILYSPPSFVELVSYSSRLRTVTKWMLEKPATDRPTARGITDLFEMMHPPTYLERLPDLKPIPSSAVPSPVAPSLAAHRSPVYKPTAVRERVAEIEKKPVARETPLPSLAPEVPSVARNADAALPKISKIVQEATVVLRDEAVVHIQGSFRRRREELLRKAEEKGLVIEHPVPDLPKDNAASIIQKALRKSLNGRHRPCTDRVNQLARPRVPAAFHHRPKPRGLNDKPHLFHPVPRAKPNPPRQAWA